MRQKTRKLGLVTLLLVLVAIAGLGIATDGNFELLEGHPVIVDGDSLRLSGERIRLLGLDAPELRQVCRRNRGEQPCGQFARKALEKLIDGSNIRCEPEDRDRYGRLLARCYAGDEDIGKTMVAAGWAVSNGEYHPAEAAARTARSGIWSMTFDDPADWRAQHDRDGKPLGFWSRLWN